MAKKEIIEFILSGKDLLSKEAEKAGVSLTELSNATRHLEAEVAKLDKLDKVNADLVGLREEAKRAADDVDSLKSEMAGYQSELQKNRATERELKKELTASVAERKKYENAVKSTNQALEANEKSQKKANDALAATNKKLEEAKSKQKGYADSIESISPAIKEAESALAAHNNEVQKSVAVEKELKTEIDAIKKELDAYTESTKEAKQAQDAANKQLSEAKAAYSSIEKSLSSAAKAVKDYGDKQDVLKAEVDGTAAALDKKRTKLADLNAKYQASVTNVNKITAEIKKYSATVEESGDPTGKLATKIQELQAKADKGNGSIAKLANDIQIATTNVTKAEAKFEAANQALTKMETAARQADSAIPQLTADLDAAGRELTDVSVNAEKLTASWQQLDATKQELDASLKTTKAALNDQKTATTELTNENKKLKAALETVSAPLKSIEKDSKKVVKEIADLEAASKKQAKTAKELETSFVQLGSELTETKGKLETLNGTIDETKSKLQGTDSAIRSNITQIKDLGVVTKESTAARTEANRELAKAETQQRNLSKALGDTVANQQRYRDGLIQAQAAQEKLRATTTTTASALRGLKAAFAAVVYNEFLQFFKNAVVTVEATELSLRSLYDSTEEQSKAFAFLVKESNRLGISLDEGSKSYIQLSAAAKEAGYTSEQTGKMWATVAQRGVELGRTSAEVSRAIQALSQIMSKGVVSSEELRQQLSEALPGSFQIAAKAMGYTTAELQKMLEQGKILQEDFIIPFINELGKGSDMDKNLETMSASLGRFANRMTLTTAAFGESIGAVTAFKTALKALNESYEFSTFVVNQQKESFNFLTESAVRVTLALQNNESVMDAVGKSYQNASNRLYDYYRSLQGLPPLYDAMGNALRSAEEESKQYGISIEKVKKIQAEYRQGTQDYIDAIDKERKAVTDAKKAEEEKKASLAGSAKSYDAALPSMEQYRAVLKQVTDEGKGYKTSVELANEVLRRLGLAAIETADDMDTFVAKLKDNDKAHQALQIQVAKTAKEHEDFGVAVEKSVKRTKEVEDRVAELGLQLEFLAEKSGATGIEFTSLLEDMINVGGTSEELKEAFYAAYTALNKLGLLTPDVAKGMQDIAEWIGIASGETKKSVKDFNDWSEATNKALKKVGIDIEDFKGGLSKAQKEASKGWQELTKDTEWFAERGVEATRLFLEKADDMDVVNDIIKTLQASYQGASDTIKDVYAKSIELAKEKQKELKEESKDTADAVSKLEDAIKDASTISEYNAAIDKIMASYTAGNITLDEMVKLVKEATKERDELAQKLKEEKDKLNDSTDALNKNTDALEDNTDAAGDVADAIEATVVGFTSLEQHIEKATKGMGASKDEMDALAGRTEEITERTNKALESMGNYSGAMWTTANGYNSLSRIKERVISQMLSEERELQALKNKAEQWSDALGDLEIDYDKLNDATDAAKYSQRDFLNALGYTSDQAELLEENINKARSALNGLDADSSEYKGLEKALDRAIEKHEEYVKKVRDAQKERYENELELIEDLTEERKDAEEEYEEFAKDSAERLSEIKQEFADDAFEHEIELMESKLEKIEEEYDLRKEKQDELIAEQDAADERRLDNIRTEAQMKIDALKGYSTGINKQEKDILGLLGEKKALEELSHEEALERLKQEAETAGTLNSTGYLKQVELENKLHQLRMEKIKDSTNAEGEQLKSLAELRTQGIVSQRAMQIDTINQIASLQQDVMIAENKAAFLKGLREEDAHQLNLKREDELEKKRLEIEKKVKDAEKASHDERLRQLEQERLAILEEEKVRKRIHQETIARINAEISGAERVAAILSNSLNTSSNSRVSKFNTNTNPQIVDVPADSWLGHWFRAYDTVTKRYIPK